MNKFLILILIFSVFSANAQSFKHSYVRIYTDGVVKQNYSLTDKEWDAIVLAVDYSLVRVQSALDDLDENIYDEASYAIQSAIHLLTLVKIATPAFEVHEEFDGNIKVTMVQSLNIVSHDGRGTERIVDAPLLKAFMVNALSALQLKQMNNAKMFLNNALESALYEDAL